MRTQRWLTAGLAGVLVYGLTAVAVAQERKPTDLAKAARLVLKNVKVHATNANGQAWDLNDGKPDLAVRVRNVSDNTIKDVLTETHNDVFEARLDAATILAAEGQEVQIEVLDRDVANDDLIGKKTFTVTAEMLQRGSADFTFDRVEGLKIEFGKP